MNRTDINQVMKTVCLDITHVCIRDNSTDTNENRVKEFKKKFMEVRVISHIVGKEY